MSPSTQLKPQTTNCLNPILHNLPLPTHSRNHVLIATPEKRATIERKLGELIQAIENHELWVPPSPNQTLYHVWDFLKRSKYMLSEFDNIEAGRALTHPNQFRPAPGTGAAAAQLVYEDVVGRNTMANFMITDTTGKTAMMTGASGPPIDFGNDCKEKARSLNAA